MHNTLFTLNVRGPSYLGLTRSISWLLMPWLLTSSGHQQPWYWLCRKGRLLSYFRKEFNYLRHIQGWVQIRIRICICIQIRKYLYLYLKNTKLAYLYLYLYLNNVFERIWKIFFKYSSNFKRISVELNNISSVACSMLPLTNWIMTHSHCNVKFPITARIYNTNDWDELLTTIGSDNGLAACCLDDAKPLSEPVLEYC